MARMTDKQTESKIKQFSFASKIVNVGVFIKAN